MSIRTAIANKIIGFGRTLGRKSGKSELKVSVSDHDIKVRMADINDTAHAWDEDMYKHGNLFYKDYGNPLKVKAKYNQGIENKDELSLSESDEAAETDENKAEVITSKRYMLKMKETVIQDLVNPTENWKKLVYGLIGVGILQFLTIITVLASTGQF